MTHTHTHTLSRTHLSLSQRPLPDDTQHSQETDIHTPAGFEPAIPEMEMSQERTLDHKATGISVRLCSSKYLLLIQRNRSV